MLSNSKSHSSVSERRLLISRSEKHLGFNRVQLIKCTAGKNEAHKRTQYGKNFLRLPLGMHSPYEWTAGGQNVSQGAAFALPAFPFLQSLIVVTRLKQL